jgi:DNA-binding response OmpR family regulator
MVVALRIHRIGRKKILIIEDELDIITIVSFTLEPGNYDLTAVTEGQEALKMINEERFDLILLDLFLEGEVNGYQICKYLKSKKNTKYIPIIMLSAAASKDEIKLGYNCGADDYITKPFEPYELLEKIRKLLKEESL